jgi:hypothetical protein
MRDTNVATAWRAVFSTRVEPPARPVGSCFCSVETTRTNGMHDSEAYAHALPPSVSTYTSFHRLITSTSSSTKLIVSRNSRCFSLGKSNAKSGKRVYFVPNCYYLLKFLRICILFFLVLHRSIYLENILRIHLTTIY